MALVQDYLTNHFMLMMQGKYHKAVITVLITATGIGGDTLEHSHPVLCTPTCHKFLIASYMFTVRLIYFREINSSLVTGILNTSFLFAPLATLIMIYSSD